MSAVLFSHALTANFVIGISIVCISMHQFFSLGTKGGAHLPAKVVISPSMDHLVDKSSPKVRGNDGAPLLPR
jgi:hypothetical protein